VPNHYNGSDSILQVFFPKKFKNIPIFFKKSRRLSGGKGENPGKAGETAA
jgi:hypothetical protein